MVPRELAARIIAGVKTLTRNIAFDNGENKSHNYFMIKCVIFALFTLNNSVFADLLPIPRTFFDSISIIESNNDDNAVGDKGKAIGRYQIWRVYYKDAKEFDKSINFSYDSLTNKTNSEKVIVAYLNRYGKKFIQNNDWVNLARIHNGGPDGYKNPSTLKYGQRFQKVMLAK